MSRAYASVLASCICLACVVHADAVSDPARPAPLPVEAFFKASDISGLQISPDGKFVAFLTKLATGKVGVALMHLDTGKVEPLVGPRDENVGFFFWKGDDRIVYGGDVGGNESAALRAISISKRRVIALAESYRERYADRANWANIVSILPNDPDHILVYGNKDIGSTVYGFWKLNVRNGRRWFIEAVDGFRTSQSSEVGSTGAILARTIDEGNRVYHEVRPDARTTFKRVAEFKGTDAGWRFLTIGGDDETLYLFTNDKTDTPEFRTMNLRSAELSEPLFHLQDAEPVNIVLSHDRKKLYGVIYENDRHRYHWFDKDRATVQARIDASLPGTFNYVTSSSLDEKMLVIHSSSDRDPGTYYLLDLRTPRIMPLGRANSQIDPGGMRPVEPIKFTARDGLTIHGYLTRPAAQATSPAPLIILPHGGPFTIRDSWAYNPEVQFLASRGYAVLQVNFRGSGGYGASFVRSGWKEWGGKMQDDLTDAVKWAVDNGIADPSRVAIFGASYGGYAALAGVTFTPDLYRCAINYVGVSDLKILNRWGHQGSYSSAAYLEHWVGTDPVYQRERSPVNYVDRIKVPTMHIYGFNDPRVDIDHWKRLRAKLVEHGKPFEEIVEKEAGHGFFDDEPRIDLYRRIEAFLAKHMPADN